MSAPKPLFWRQTLLLAALYFIIGKLGLLLAVPPGYATVIWPPSGIALGMLITHGRHLWPGVLLGSFLLNCHVSGVYTADGGVAVAKAMTALGIAAGSTAQALIGRWLIHRWIGLPLKLNHIVEIFRLFCLCGPIACLIAASVGVGALYLSGALPPDKITENWLTWWTGDVLGILIFLPLMLIAPGSKTPLVWRGNTLGSLPLVTMLVLAIPLGLTFYAWKIASENIYARSYAEFDALAIESEKALLHRIDSYESALLGGEGFFQGSESVSRTEWKRYVETTDIKNSRRSIEPLPAQEMPEGRELLDAVADDLGDGEHRHGEDGAGEPPHPVPEDQREHHQHGV